MSFNPKTGRDQNLLRQGFTRWFGQYFGHEVEVAPLVTPTEGFSNETAMISVRFPDGQNRAFVARLPPPGNGLFPVYDLEKQARVQTILADQGLPTARPIAYETDTSWIGFPFVLMDRIAGRPTDDSPSYVASGWLSEMNAAQQATVLENFMVQMARIHRLDWRSAGLGIAARKVDSADNLKDEWQWWIDYLKWLYDPAFHAGAQEIESVFNWLRDNWPDRMPPDSFLWGDPRTANLLYDGTDVTAILDLENMTIAPAEFDVGWWMAYRRNMFTDDIKTLPELPGFPDHDASLAMYGERLGRPLEHMDFFEVFGAARIAACSYGIRKMIRERGVDIDTLYFPPFFPEWVRVLMRRGRVV